MVVTVHTLRGRGRASGLEITSQAALVWSVHNGQVIRIVGYNEPREALKAAGLEE